MTTVVQFAGQGIQRIGMGAELFRRFPELVAQANDVLGYSIRELCLDDPHDRLRRTRYSQPAIYVVNALAGRALDVDADVYVGHSLGEYNALEAAGVFDFATGVELVRARAEFMDTVDGFMAMVLGLPTETVERALATRPDLEASIAAFNAPTSVVVAGPGDDTEVGTLLREAGALGIRPLRVSGPFHTRHMAPAATAFAPVLRASATHWRVPRVPVIGNRHARPHRLENLVADLTEQITHPVLWQQSLVRLLGPDVCFHEAYGSVLTTLTRQIRRHHRSLEGLR